MKHWDIPKFCLLRDDRRLLRIIDFAARSYGVVKLAKDLGLNAGNLYGFLTGRTKKLTQATVLRICEHLGIKVELSFKYEPDKRNPIQGGAQQEYL